MKFFALTILSFSCLISCIQWDGIKKVQSEATWLKILGPKPFETMRRGGTDPAFVGEYAYPKSQPQIYMCAACDLCLFRLEDQYDAGGGFPSFKQAIHSRHLHYTRDFSLPIQRYEVLCRKCDSHLGHLFHDGPPPKYFRYCINSSALRPSLKGKIE